MWAAIRPWLFPIWCIGCGEPEAALCAACASAAKPQHFTLGGIAIRAAALYDGQVRSAVIALKRGERAYLDPLAALLEPLVASGVPIVPLPTTRRRAAERGFDQARELARRLASRGAAVADILAKRGGAQRGRGRNERLTARGRFAVRPHVPVPSTAFLLDDVVTTGATLLDAARVLEAAGCRIAGAVVVARTLPGRETPRAGRRLVEA